MFSITRFGRFAGVTSLLIWISACGGESGNTIPAPSGLSYSTPPAYTVNAAIAPLNPTVMGAVNTYTVTPALPAGLNINATAGVISGTPTTVTAKASYTVTANNAGGSTSAVVAIVVNDVAPLIAYASPYYSFTVGVAAQTITPIASGGSIVSWSVTPALPAGLSLSTSTGTIQGTPTAGIAPTAFVVAATNSGGNSAMKLTLAVSGAPLLDVGHAAKVSSMAFAGSRLLSADTSGHWVLWNYASGAMLSSGDAPAPNSNSSQAQVALAGPTAVVETGTGLQVLAASNGTVEGNIAATLLWWTLASDGSYICGATSNGLTMWSTSGAVLFTQAGDYSMAVVYAAPGQVQAALGPAGQNVIQTIAVPTGVATVSPAFQGTFLRWFSDGARFFTAVGDNTVAPATVWIYSSSAMQQELTNSIPPSALFGLEYLGGEGNWFWSLGDNDLNIYAVGGNTTPVATYEADAPLFISGTTLGALSASSVNIIDLSGASPTSAIYALPIGGTSVFAASSSSSWVVGNSLGVLVDGASLSGTPRYLDYGEVLGIAGSASDFAIATASGRILLYESSTNTLQGMINFASSLLAVSSDGSVLAALAAPSYVVNSSTQPLNVYELPATVPSNSLTFGSFSVLNMTLSGSGTSALLGLAISTPLTPPGPPCTAEAIPVLASAPIWCDTSAGIEQLQISPDGTLMAASTAIPGFPGSSVDTNIYLNGTISSAISGGYALAWLDNSTLLVNTFLTGTGNQPTVYNGAAIFSSTGTQQTTVPLPELDVVQVISAQSIYSAHPNGIFSLPSGAETWTSASPLSLLGGTLPYAGAATGSEVIFPSGNLVLAESTSAP